MPTSVFGELQIDAQFQGGRVESNGDLTVDVRAFEYEIGGTKGRYVGATNQAVTDDDETYVYLDQNAALQITTSVWPSTEHIRLAKVVAANGIITAISDQRAFLTTNVSDAHTHSNKAQLDLVTDGGHDARADNPHGTDLGNLGGGTLAELNAAISDDDVIGSSEKGAANGVATLDAGSKIPSAQIPAVALPEFHVVADETARLALTVQEGDEAKQTDDGSHWIYDGSTWYVRPGNVDGVNGPASATDNAVVRYDGTTGKVVQNSGASIDDSGNITANNLSGTNTGDEAAASETVAGVAEIATQAEVDAGTDDTRFVTPAKLAATAGNGKLLVSSNDTTVGYLNGKLCAASPITLTELNNGGDEQLRVGIGNHGNTHGCNCDDPVDITHLSEGDAVHNYSNRGGFYDDFIGANMKREWTTIVSGYAGTSVTLMDMDGGVVELAVLTDGT